MSSPQRQIAAEAHTDDGMVRVTFDATSYFEQATDDELRALMECDFGYDYPADAVVYTLEQLSPALEFMVAYIRRLKAGFECSVNADQANEWIRHNRPYLFAERGEE